MPFTHHHLMPDESWIEGMWTLILTIKLLTTPPPRPSLGHSFEGVSPLWPPLPGKAIKLLFSTSPKTLSLKFNSVLGYRGQIRPQGQVSIRGTRGEKGDFTEVSCAAPSPSLVMKFVPSFLEERWTSSKGHLHTAFGQIGRAESSSQVCCFSIAFGSR